MRYANERDIDLIIMGTHGRSGVAHLLLGSVAEHVVRRGALPGTARPPPQDRCRQGRRHKRGSERRGSAQEGGAAPPDVTDALAGGAA